jgi:hypothetical protein
MSNGVYLKLPHKIDIYIPTVIVNAAGQRTFTYTLAATIQAFFQSMSSERRILPYVDNIDEMQFYVSFKDAQYIDYNNRIQNIVDRYGNLIEAGPIEMVNIQKQTGYSGKVRHIFINGRRVVENA